MWLLLFYCIDFKTYVSNTAATNKIIDMHKNVIIIFLWCFCFHTLHGMSSSTILSFSHIFVKSNLSILNLKLVNVIINVAKNSKATKDIALKEFMAIASCMIVPRTNDKFMQHMQPITPNVQ